MNEYDRESEVEEGRAYGSLEYDDMTTPKYSLL